MLGQSLQPHILDDLFEPVLILPSKNTIIMRQGWLNSYFWGAAWLSG
jgi:hypothetical protein